MGKYISDFDELLELQKDICDLMSYMKDEAIQVKAFVRHIRKEKKLRQLEYFKKKLHDKIQLHKQKQQDFNYNIEPYEHELTNWESFNLDYEIQSIICSALKMISLIKRFHERIQERKQYL